MFSQFPSPGALRHCLNLFAALLLAGCAAVRAPEAVDIHKPDLDTRSYRYLELPNHLRVILVSDPQTDKAAASLHVRVGSGNDPRSREGLAHFLEHMLFLGTGRYPDPGEYMDFISAHGGSNNAYTAIDHTNYFFDIEPGSLDPALDRFAQFFVAPLFNPEYVEREMNAVDAEFHMGLKDDSRREYDVLRELVQPEHPLASFSVGNLQTLRDGGGDVRQDLLTFYEQHYSANLMTLVVLGRESLDQLQTMVGERFGAISNHNAVARTSAPPLFVPGSLPMEVDIQPEKDLRELSLLFPVPSARSRYAAKPLEHIGNLLGHEGPGSPLSVLKARGWVESLGAGAGLDLYGEDAMQISVRLTQAGLEHHQEIVALLFGAIARLREQGLDEWRFREQASLSQAAFRYREKGSSTGTVISLANALQDYPVSEVIRGPYVYRDFDRELLREYLDYLRPDNVLITLTHKGAVADKRSGWYRAPYAVSHPDASRLATGAETLAATLKLPAPNEFIAQHFELKPRAAVTRPELLQSASGFRLWHLQESEFLAPKASVYFQLLTPAAGESARNAAFTELYAQLIEDRLNEFAYPATLAGLQYEISGGGRGLTVKISGYDDKQSVLLDKILQVLQAPHFQPERFASIKTELLRDWRNSAKQKPFLQLVDRLGVGMIEHRWTDSELLQALQPEDQAALDAFAARFREHAALEVLVHGNYTAAEAGQLGGHIRDSLIRTDGGAPEVPALRVLELPSGVLSSNRVEIRHPDSAALLFIQGVGFSDAERARMALSAQILSAPFFDELRTEQQLGYAVFAQNYPMYRVPGLLFAVQSANTGATQVARAIRGFLDDFATTAANMDEAEFQRHRQTLMLRLRESPKSLGERSERLWSDIALGSLNFDDRERIALAVGEVSLADWQAFYRDRLDGVRGRALLLYSQGAAQKQMTGTPAPIPGKALDSLDALHGNAKYYRFDWGRTGQDAESALNWSERPL